MIAIVFGYISVNLTNRSDAPKNANERKMRKEERNRERERENRRKDELHSYEKSKYIKINMLDTYRICRI